jgi:hypothetical protein
MSEDRSSMAAGFERVAQLEEVVDLAVGDDVHVAGLVRDRLLSRGEIDDRQAAHAEGGARQAHTAGFVGTAVQQRLHHAGDVRIRRHPRRVTFDNGGDTTHG